MKPEKQEVLNRHLTAAMAYEAEADEYRGRAAKLLVEASVAETKAKAYRGLISEMIAEETVDVN